MPPFLPQPSSTDLAAWLWCAATFVFAGLWVWSKIRKPPKTEIAQPIDIRMAREFASKKSVEALFAMHRSLRAESEQKMAEQRDEIMAAIDKNRAEQREDIRQLFDLIRDLSASTHTTAALVESINRKISP
jgi:hypothetical protein